MVKNTISSAFISVTDDPISERAHQIYVERGRADGFDREDWFRAEREFNAQPTIAPKKGLARVRKTVKHTRP